MERFTDLLCIFHLFLHFEFFLCNARIHVMVVVGHCLTSNGRHINVLDGRDFSDFLPDVSRETKDLA